MRGKLILDLVRICTYIISIHKRGAGMIKLHTDAKPSPELRLMLKRMKLRYAGSHPRYVAGVGVVHDRLVEVVR